MSKTKYWHWRINLSNIYFHWALVALALKEINHMLNTYSECQMGQRGVKSYTLIHRQREGIRPRWKHEKLKTDCSGSQADVWRWQDAVTGSSRCRWVESGVTFCKKWLGLGSALWKTSSVHVIVAFPVGSVIIVTTVWLHNRDYCPCLLDMLLNKAP